MTPVVPFVQRGNGLIVTFQNIVIADFSQFYRSAAWHRESHRSAQAIEAFTALKETKFASAQRINISSYSRLKAFALTLYNYFSFHIEILLDSLFLPQFQNYSMSACS